MIYTLLILVFIGGLRISLADWKQTFKSLNHYRAEYGRDPNVSPIFTGCTCGECTPEQLEEMETRAEEHHLQYLNNLAKALSYHLHQSIMHSGLTLIALYFIIELTLKP